MPNGIYLVNSEPVEDYPDIDTPPTWTSLLCHKELACDVHDNFAVPNRVGVDKATYINNLTWVDAGSDLKDQVRKWIEFEEMRASSSKNNGRETLFTVWFGISDVMKFSLLKKREGIVAVEHSLEVLFLELVSNSKSLVSPRTSMETLKLTLRDRRKLSLINHKTLKHEFLYHMSSTSPSYRLIPTF